MNNMNDFSWLSGLKTPSREYTPIPFWFLNGNLTHEEIRRQLQDFRDHGVYGVVLHPRMGLSRRIQYLSPVFFRYLRTAVETAAELEMTVVLYDEGMYPSGSAGGGFPWFSRRLPGIVCCGRENLAFSWNASAAARSGVCITARMTDSPTPRKARIS